MLFGIVCLFVLLFLVPLKGHVHTHTHTHIVYTTVPLKRIYTSTHESNINKNKIFKINCELFTISWCVSLIYKNNSDVNLVPVEKCTFPTATLQWTSFCVMTIGQLPIASTSTHLQYLLCIFDSIVAQQCNSFLKILWTSNAIHSRNESKQYTQTIQFSALLSGISNWKLESLSNVIETGTVNYFRNFFSNWNWFFFSKFYVEEEEEEEVVEGKIRVKYRADGKHFNLSYEMCVHLIKNHSIYSRCMELETLHVHP